MAKTPSNMIPLGSTAPDFALDDVISGNKITLQEISQGRPVVIMFICNHCPFVIAIQKVLVEIVHEYQEKGIAFAAINSNDTESYPDDAPDKMQELASNLEFRFPYLFDQTQEIAKRYQAACTPDFYLFDQELKCVYRGQFDDSRPENGIEVTGKDLKNAMDCLLAGEKIPLDQKPSIGCNIKWISE